METIVLNKPGELVIAHRSEPPAPGPGEALVQIARVGVCGTDIHAFGGKQPFFNYPRVLGHELGVTVLAVGPGVHHLQVGDRCAVEPYLNCGVCVACRRQKGNCCTRMQVLGVHVDGGMCKYIVVPAAKLHPSAKLSLEQLALVEPLGIGAHAVDRAKLEKDEWALVVGLGPIGLAALQFVIAAGARPIVMEPNAHRANFCRVQLGVDCVIDPTDSPVERLSALTGGEMPTAVFDATGNPNAMMASFKYVAHGGRLVFIGLFQGDVTFHDPDFHRREMTLMGSRNSRSSDFSNIIRLVESGQVNTDPWVTHRGVLSDVPALFPQWINPQSGVIKAIIEVP